jgi:arsenate reductase-like glutaredoxin family protein
MALTFLHNPRRGKSRDALAPLPARGAAPAGARAPATPRDARALDRILRALGRPTEALPELP